MFRLVIFSALLLAVSCDYWTDRKKVIQDETRMEMGGRISLTEKEQQANKILMSFKAQELEDGFKDPGKFPPAMHFFKARAAIEKSMVYSIIKQMPKGAALHLHDTAMISPDWLVKNITYRENLYTKLDGIWNFVFSRKKPDNTWQNVNELRARATSVEEFDKWLASIFSMQISDPETAYPDINAVWEAFMKVFRSITPMLTYRPVFEDYMYEVLNMFRRDNVFYIEMRGTLPELYDLDGKVTSDPKELTTLMYNINKRFIADHPESLGMKFIYGNLRGITPQKCDEYLQIVKDIHKLYPDFVAGFDLVGQEDTGKPLIDFVNNLKDYKKDFKYFFHAGETNWNGMSTDWNLLDAVLLNTSRIGHGYALIKHPKIMQEVRKRNIAIEVNPISNQVLLLVKDLRNHPAQILIALDYPVVISCDDPGFWGATGLSHDFYEAFMGMASSSADLRMLKQLALNSIEYSAMNDSEKCRALAYWDVDWKKFIDNVIKQYKNLPNVKQNTISKCFRCFRRN